MKKIIDLTERQVGALNDALEEFDEQHFTSSMEGNISIGIEENGKIVAGLDAEITVYKILYVSTVFVDEEYRRKGYGKALIQEMEKRAKKLGANTIRLDTFDYQGKDFYLAMGYTQAGFYRNEEDNYEEYFFVKFI